MRHAWPVLCLILFALGACERAAAPWPHEAYVWQRHWDDELRAALAASGDTFAGFRVLAAESDRRGALTPIAPDLAALARSGRAVTAVLRINGSDPPPDAAALAARIAALARDWRGAGVRLAGVEIDHDCATARLPAYAALLASLRATLAPELRLSFTALPTWLEAPDALAAARGAADASVLQVHAVRDPAQGLFDAHAAQRWIARYAAVSPRPFRVALPAYGVRASFDANGHAVAVQAETARDDAAEDVRELSAAPADVAQVLEDLHAAPPAGFQGVVWFRLPRADDRRAWSLATLRAVIARAPLTPRVDVRLDANSAGAARDLVLTNAGAIDAALPHAIAVVASKCAAADAVNGYRLDSVRGGWRFVAADAGAPLRAGRARRIGWVQCAHVSKVSIDENP